MICRGSSARGTFPPPLEDSATILTIEVIHVVAMKRSCCATSNPEPCGDLCASGLILLVGGAYAGAALTILHIWKRACLGKVCHLV